MGVVIVDISFCNVYYYSKSIAYNLGGGHEQ